MAEWILFLHAPRENFATTMTTEEQAAFAEHFAYLERLHAEGRVVLVGPTLGRVNTGILVFEADDEQAAQRIADEDPTVLAGVTTPELRPFRVSMLRGRD